MLAEINFRAFPLFRILFSTDSMEIYNLNMQKSKSILASESCYCVNGIIIFAI